MKAFTLLVSLALVASVGLNVWFWKQRTAQLAATEAARVRAAEQMEQAKQRAQAIACVNNLKQIGLAARIYAKDHGKVFPPDFVAVKDELVTPKILFCPAAPGGAQARTWEELNPTTISYQFQNPGGDESDPQKLLTTCPIHGNYGLSDGSVQMPRK